MSSSSRRRATRLPARSEKRLDTLKSAYESNAVGYAATTPQRVEGSMKWWMDRTISCVAPGSRVLEVGSGTGRDAQYFEQAGLLVQRTDIAQSFVDILRDQGHSAVVLDAVRDPFPGDFELVFANAVVCHFEKDQFSQFLRRAHLSLNSDGVLAFSTKHAITYKSGSRQFRLGVERRFSMWPTDELVTFVEKHGFKVIHVEVTDAIRSSSKWINLIARKVLQVDSLEYLF